MRGLWRAQRFHVSALALGVTVAATAAAAPADGQYLYVGRPRHS